MNEETPSAQETGVDDVIYFSRIESVPSEDDKFDDEEE